MKVVFNLTKIETFRAQEVRQDVVKEEELHAVRRDHGEEILERGNMLRALYVYSRLNRDQHLHFNEEAKTLTFAGSREAMVGGGALDAMLAIVSRRNKRKPDFYESSDPWLWFEPGGSS